MQSQNDEPEGYWTVTFDSEEYQLTTFRAALSYADGLALKKKLIKEINPESHRISFVPSSGWQSSFDCTNAI